MCLYVSFLMCIFLSLCFTFTFFPPNCCACGWLSGLPDPSHCTKAPPISPFLSIPSSPLPSSLHPHFEALFFSYPLSFALSSCVDEIRWFLLGEASVHPSAAPSRAHPTSVQVINQAGQTLLRLRLPLLLLFLLLPLLHPWVCCLSPPLPLSSVLCVPVHEQLTVGSLRRQQRKHPESRRQTLIIETSIIQQTNLSEAYYSFIIQGSLQERFHILFTLNREEV